MAIIIPGGVREVAGHVTCNSCGHRFFGAGGQVLYPCPECGFEYNNVDDLTWLRKMESMRLIYLASPYCHPELSVIEDRVEKNRLFVIWLIKRGKLIYSPILHNHEMTRDGSIRRGWEHWSDQDALMIYLAHEFWVLRLDGWEESQGVTKELDIAAMLAKPIMFFDYEVSLADGKV